MTSLRVGIGLRTSELRAQGADAGGNPGAGVALGVRAEAAGLELLWLVEDAMAPPALPVLAALAVRTRRLGLAALVSAAADLHPLRLAEDLASVDGISDGRLELGLGAGSPPPGSWGRAEADEEDGFATREELSSQLCAVFGGDVPLAPAPTRPAGPPLWLAAGTAGQRRRVGERGAGLLLETPGEAWGPYLEAGRRARPMAADGMRIALLLPGEADVEALAAAARTAGLARTRLASPAPGLSVAPVRARPRTRPSPAPSRLNPMAGPDDVGQARRCGSRRCR